MEVLGDGEVGALGLLIFQAAKTGSAAGLRFALSRKNAKEHVNYQDATTQMRTPLMAAAVNGHLQCVKLLVAHSADLHLMVQGPRPRSHKHTALSLASKHSHTRVANYLQGCIDDVAKGLSTRAHVEAEVVAIADSTDCSEETEQEFTSKLRWLLDNGGYELQSQEDEEQSLLIRAARADNVVIVHKLVEEFGVKPTYTSHPETAENVLHYACHNLSQLRYYFAGNYRELLCIPDSKGNSPLYVVCARNDVEFVSWLFHGVLCGRECRGSGLGGVRWSSGRFSRQRSNHPAGQGAQIVGIPARPRAESHTPTPSPTPLGSGIIRLLSQVQVAPETAIPPHIDTLRSNSQLWLGTADLEDSDEHSNELLTSLPTDCYDDPCSHESVTFHITPPGIPEEPGDLPSPPPAPVELPVSFIADMKLFRKNIAGESILHLLACHGHSELLAILLKVAERLKHVMGDDELGVLTRREGFTIRTPIEEGLMVGNLECVRLLIDFAENVNLIKNLFEDEDILKVAVLFTEGGSNRNVEALKMLISYGFKTGLAKSVTLADLKEQKDITRLLLFYQTQVINSQEFAKVHLNHTVSLKVGRIKWEGFNLRHIDGLWIHDANCAVDSVSRVFHDPEYRVHKLYRHTQEFFRTLGMSCLSYFSNLDPPSSLERSYVVPLVEINLAENHLTSVPPEIFQQRHLRTLQLSHNELEELPTSGSLNETLYACPRLSKLDLDWNQLKTVPEEMCRGLGNSLEELNLVQNQLTDLPPGLWVMRKLKKLKLNGNSLTHLHKLSSPHYFSDPLLSQKVVTLFEAGPDGELQTAEGGRVAKNKMAVDRVRCYLEILMSFLRTVLVMMGKDDPSVNLAQEVINIHWQRYNSSSDNSAYVPRPASSSVIDALFDAIEEEGEIPLTQRGLTALQELHLNQNGFQEVPWDLPCLVPHLTKVYLNQNEITDLDIVRSLPSRVTTLCLSKNQIVTTAKRRPLSLPCGFPLFLLSIQPERGGCRDYCTHCQHSSLDAVTKITLDSNQLEKFSLVELDGEHEERPQPSLQGFTTIDIQLLFPNVAFLDLNDNSLKQVPDGIEKLTHLSCLNLSRNTSISELPEELGMLNPQVFLTLGLEGLFIRNIPPSLLVGKVGVTRNIICYLKSIREKSQVYRRIKLMVVGEDNKGKTSLLLSLTKSGSMVRFKEVAMDHHQQPLATNGVELGDWEYAPRGKEKVTFMTWDFGGQEEYYATHQCFLTNRSLFLLVWNVEDGERGLLSLRFWLENIEVRAKDSLVIVVATHADSLPQANFKDHVARLQSRLMQLYCLGHDSFAYPRICSAMYVVNCKDSRHMEQLRNYIYHTAVQYCPPPPTQFSTIRPSDIEPLLDQKVPESYIKLQDIVRNLAHACARKNRSPIFTRQEYMARVHESGEIHASNDELDQATNFLHSNGILLHYNDSQLNHLYFVNPQWLCSALANVITIRARNPHVKDGIISMSDLKRIIRSTTSSVEEIISIMEIFQVIYKLDEERLLIPSLLPNCETTPHVVMPRSVMPHVASPEFMESPAPIHSFPDLLVRYLILPFTPNGFFPRLIARVLHSDLATQVQSSLCVGPLDSAHALNRVHWQCWRNGISLVWNHMEVVRIAPLSFPLPRSHRAIVVSSLPANEEREVLKGMEIMVALLPEDQTLSCPIIPPSQPDGGCNRSRCMATWILQRATELAETVMEDWYEVFGFRRNLGNLLSCMTTPCPACFKAGHGQSDTKKNDQTSPESTSNGPPQNQLHMFTLPFCNLQLKHEGTVRCPLHGDLEVSQVAPDLVFADFAPSALIPSKDVKLVQRLGDGGFGLVSLGHLSTRDDEEPIKVALKEIRPSKTSIDCNIPELEEETLSWYTYHEASLEARMMYQLDHPHILTLLGLTLNPVKLVLELAREDLSDCVARYQKKRERLGRRTLRATLTQIAEAMSYLHGKNILYRDLKPGNVLVWEFPEPGNQYSPDATVLVKLADYGISKQIGPQGIHSKVGTPQYLPPEVLLHSEHEAASLKVDVYSFGMVVYYLFTCKSPFGSSFLVGSQLRSGRRPKLPTKYWPNSVQMVELMTWCWSENPTHRPSFDQILSVLQSDTTWSLVGGTSVTSDDEVHSACARVVAIPHRRHSSTFSPLAVGPGQGQSCTRLASVIPPRTCGIGLQTGIEVWYGTMPGKLSIVWYHSPGTLIEPVQHQSSSFISSIVSVLGSMWVASLGGGLWVYDSASRRPMAMWGETERAKIYQLIVVQESQVLALTKTGMYLFSAQLEDESQTVDVLEPLQHRPHSGLQNTVGVYVPQSGDISRAELWVCPQSGQWLQVLSPKDLAMKMEVEIPASQNKKIRHMEVGFVRGKSHVFLADRHMLLKYEVRSRELVGVLDLYTACWTEPTASSPPLKQGRVTSLAAGNNETLYIGNGAGIILLVNSHSMEVFSRLKAYNTPTRCLQLIISDNLFNSVTSVDSAPYCRRNSSTTSMSPRNTSSPNSVLSPPPPSTPGSPDSQNKPSLLLSFGLGYSGVTESATNRPESFLLPHGLSPCSCCTHFLARSQPGGPLNGYILLWSKESLSRSAYIMSDDNFDGSSE